MTNVELILIILILKFSFDAGIEANGRGVNNLASIVNIALALVCFLLLIFRVS